MIADNSYFIQLDDLSYPHTLLTVRQQKPNVSIPSFPTEEQMLSLGYALVISQDKPTGNVVEEGQPVIVDGQWLQTWTVRDFTAEEIAANLEMRKQELIQLVESKRDSELTTPYPITLGEGVTQHLKMQFDDKFVLTHLLLKAKQYLADGITELLPLRTLENQTWQLAPEQIVAILNGLLKHGEDIYRVSWQYKDQIRAANSIDELPVVPDVLVLLV